MEENLRQLGRDYLDVVNLRRMRQESIAEHFGALADLRDAGLIRHLGVSNVTVTHLEEALAIAPVVCVQNRYALDQREHEPVLLACVERSIAFVPFFSLIGAGDAPASAGAVRTDPPAAGRSGAPRSGRPPPRSGWRGRCTTRRTCWPSPAPATPPTSRRTSPRPRSASPPRTCPCWTPAAGEQPGAITALR